MPGFIKIPGELKWEYLNLCVDFINNALNFATNLNIYADKDGIVDLYKMQQTLAALRLIFADFIALNF